MIWKFIRWLNLLSLDVAAGSFALSVLAVRILDISMPLGWWLALPLTVWLMYTADHLIDGFGRDPKSISKRHLFHQQNIILFLITGALAATVLCLIIFCFLPREIILGGAVIGFCCIVYLIYARFSIHHWIPKELIVGIIYTIGIWFAPVLYGKRELWIVIPIGLTFLSAINNLLIFSILGENEDRGGGFGSIVISFGEERVTKWVQVSVLIAALLALYFSIIYLKEIILLATGLIFLLMNLCLGMMLFYKKIFQKNDLYRLVGDGVFLLPLFVFFI